MATLVVGTDSTDASEALADYLDSAAKDADEVHIVNSLPGGEATSADDVQAGKEEIDLIADRLDGLVAAVETHQYIQGNEPLEDLQECATEVDADEYVICIRKHTPAGKMVFGSVAQNLLLSADRPVRCVPLGEATSAENLEKTPTAFQNP
jgi:nucleotide-binding universal stress UspA family protein